MRAYLIFLVSTMVLSSGALADTDQAKDIQMAQMCADCHGADGIDLSGAKVDAVVAGINAIRAGDAEHPTKLDSLSDADVEEIAKILTRDY